MAIVKLSNRGVKDITAVGSIGTGDLTFISKQTASSDASISFTSGIDSTYKEYIFFFNNIHPSASNVKFMFNFSTDSGSNYNVTKTTTMFNSYHNEADNDSGLAYNSGNDLAQSTGNQPLLEALGTDNDQASSGYMQLFNPSSSVFMKHYISDFSNYHYGDYSQRFFSAGYGNTTSAIDGVRFKMSSGNIDAGTIKLYGIKDS